MLLIPCPWCGDRHESEFVCGGPRRVRRPEDAGELSQEAWIDYLTLRPNPKGSLVEWWWHARGCEGWFLLERDTLTHALRALPAGGDDDD
jgi:heterotetrameric sarcosine oxidase delta subunit